MKQILSLNYAIIGDFVLSHPSTIFTDDNIEVITAETDGLLNYEIAKKTPSSFPAIPETGEFCEANKIYCYSAKMVKCIQSHNRMNFTPEQTPALFLIIEHAETVPVWKQSTGAHDAYKKGDRVHFPTASDSIYESLIDANVWSPTVYPQGWKKL